MKLKNNCSGGGGGYPRSTHVITVRLSMCKRVLHMWVCIFCIYNVLSCVCQSVCLFKGRCGGSLTGLRALLYSPAPYVQNEARTVCKHVVIILLECFLVAACVCVSVCIYVRVCSVSEGCVRVLTTKPKSRTLSHSTTVPNASNSFLRSSFLTESSRLPTNSLF